MQKIIQLEGVSKTYEGLTEVHALKPTSLSIDDGELISIQGTSGSGKTTLMNLLGLLDTPTQGKYSFGGLDTGSLSELERSSLRGMYFGFVFQAFHLLSDRSAAENVELGLLYRGVEQKVRKEMALTVLEQVGLSHRVESFPNTLSGGERQRVAIGRALVGRPKVILCDEPTGNLDGRNSAMILQLLVDLNSLGLTIVIVTHDTEVASMAGRHLHVEDGVVSE